MQYQPYLVVDPHDLTEYISIHEDNNKTNRSTHECCTIARVQRYTHTTTFSSDPTWDPILVINNPGAIALTVIECGANSPANFNVK
jgi:hypothetical protein